jgi:hypothetical protein
MVEQCITIDLLAPTNIISTNMIVSSSNYVEPCAIEVVVEWQNIGDITGIFTPSIKIDGDTIQHSSEPLDGSQTVSHSFTISNLMAGSHTIEADPNTGTIPQTIIVYSSQITSSTLIVEQTDCTTPCTINGTVSWTNNGGAANLPIDLSITVNGTQHIVASNVTIDPGQTTELYQFSLPDLAAGIYEICASPDSDTVCQTVVIKTQANIVPTIITPSKTTCTTPCSLTIDVTWENNGQTSGTFVPTITVDNMPTSLLSESLDAETSVITTFTLTGLTTGDHLICADPNLCTTINVSNVTICSWITSKGGWQHLAVFDIMTLVGAYLGQTNIGFTVTSAHIMGCVAYYLNNMPSGNSLTGCSFT